MKPTSSILSIWNQLTRIECPILTTENGSVTPTEGAPNSSTRPVTNNITKLTEPIEDCHGHECKKLKLRYKSMVL